MYEKTLVASDLTAASDAVIACLQGLQPLGTKSIVLMHALGIRHLEELRHLLEPFVMPRLQEQQRVIEGHGFAVETIVAAGIEGPEIVRVAKQTQSALIVVGSQGASLAREALLGGVALKVLHRAPTPVLIIRLRVTDAEERRCEAICKDFRAHLLFATDFSDVAETAFSHVRGLVRIGCRKVTLLHVQDTAHKHRSIPSMRAEADRIDLERLSRMKRSLDEAGATDVAIDMPYGIPKIEIARRAESGDCSLLVVGTQGRGSVGSLLLGSVAHHVANNAISPVLLIPPQR